MTTLRLFGWIVYDLLALIGAPFRKRPDPTTLDQLRGLR